MTKPENADEGFDSSVCYAAYSEYSKQLEAKIIESFGVPENRLEGSPSYSSWHKDSEHVKARTSV